MKIKNKQLPIWKTSKPLYLTPKDKRYKKYKNQLNKRSFSNTELWNLDFTIAAFVLPRLKEFRDNLMSYPSIFKNIEEWRAVLDKIIYSFEYTCFDLEFEGTEIEQKENYKRYEDGLKLFGEYFSGLWD